MNMNLKLTKKPFSSHYKIVISGEHIEMINYEEPISYNRSKKNSGANIYLNKKEQTEISDSSYNRAKRKIMRIINSNAGFYKKNGKKIIPQFITYTFAENETNIKEANEQFTNYIKRLNYNFFSSKKAVLKYLAVIEFQKRGAIHYHVIFFNLPKIINEEERETRYFQKIWGLGYIESRDVENTKNVGFYMTKYMTKDAKDKRLIRQKKYFRSKGLKESIEIVNEELSKELIKYIFINYKKKIKESEIDTERNGRVKFANLKVNQKQLKDIMKKRRKFYLAKR